MCLWHFTVWDISLNTGNITHQNGDNIGDNNRVYPYIYILLYIILYYIISYHIIL